MSKISTPTPSSLSERLRQNEIQVQAELVGQTQKLLQQHGLNLKRLSSDALRTTSSATARLQNELAVLHAQTVKRLRWMLLWPIAGSIVMSILIVLTTLIWAAGRLDQIGQAQDALDQSSAALAAQQRALQVTPPPSPSITTTRKRR